MQPIKNTQADAYSLEAYNLAKDTNRVACELFRFMQSLYYTVGKSNKTYSNINKLLSNEISLLRLDMDEITSNHYTKATHCVQHLNHIVPVDSLFYNSYGFSGNLEHRKKKKPLDKDISIEERQKLNCFIKQIEELVPRLNELKNKSRRCRTDLDKSLKRLGRVLDKLK